jgi:hypothetical protein
VKTAVEWHGPRVYGPTLGADEGESPDAVLKELRLAMALPFDPSRVIASSNWLAAVPNAPAKTPATDAAAPESGRAGCHQRTWAEGLEHDFAQPQLFLQVSQIQL